MFSLQHRRLSETSISPPGSSIGSPSRVICVSNGWIYSFQSPCHISSHLSSLAPQKHHTTSMVIYFWALKHKVPHSLGLFKCLCLTSSDIWSKCLVTQLVVSVGTARRSKTQHFWSCWLFFSSGAQVLSIVRVFWNFYVWCLIFSRCLLALWDGSHSAVPLFSSTSGNWTSAPLLGFEARVADSAVFMG